MGRLEHSSEGGRRGRGRKNALDCSPCLAHALEKQNASLESEAKVCRRYVHVANAERPCEPGNYREIWRSNMVDIRLATVC